MLRISELKSATTIRQFYASRHFYEKGLGIVGVWGGFGAERLGLRGTVTRTKLEWLCENIHPVNGHRLTVRMQPGRTVAYTFRFSPCKSVSLLYGLYQDKAILGAFRTAVIETMREMEAEMKTRLRKGGHQAERATGNMVWGEFIHTVATPVDGMCDPQLHAYLPVFNATWDEVEDCWKAGWFQDLVRDAPYFEAVFRSRAAHLIGSLGFKVRRKGKDFEIAGVPDELIGRFSRRTETIEDKADVLGMTDPRAKGKLGPKTREGNVAAHWTPDALRWEWAGRLSHSEVRTLEEAYESRTQPSELTQSAGDIVSETLRRHRGRGAIPERCLVMEMLIAGMGDVTVESVRRELAKRPVERVGDGRECALLL